MIVLHKDHPVYNLPDEPIGTGRYHHNLGDKYYLKFKEHFDKNNLDYRLTYYEDYPNVDGEYFIGRFAHAKEDKELHSKVYYELEKRFDNIWPNKLTYELYDDKPKEMKYIDSIGYSNLVDYVIVNSFEELVDIIKVGDVVKSYGGASSDNVLLITEQKYCDGKELRDLLEQTYAGVDNFFPCIIQPQYKGSMYKIHITNFGVHSKVFNLKQDLSNPLNFGVGNPNVPWLDRHTYTDEDCYGISKDELQSISILDDLIQIKDTMKTPNMTFDIMENKILEFSYIYTPSLPYRDEYGFYNFDTKEFETIKEDQYFLGYEQVNSVIKEFNL